MLGDIFTSSNILEKLTFLSSEPLISFPRILMENYIEWKIICFTDYGLLEMKPIRCVNRFGGKHNSNKENINI